MEGGRGEEEGGKKKKPGESDEQGKGSRKRRWEKSPGRGREAPKVYACIKNTYRHTDTHATHAHARAHIHTEK